MADYQRVVNYAKALFETPGSAEEIDQRQQQLSLIGDLIAEHPDVLVLLGCPEIEIEKRLDILQRIVKDPLNPFIGNLLKLLMQRRLVHSIRAIAQEYHKLVNHSLKEIDAEVITAEPLGKEEKQLLISKLEEKFGKKANVLETIDPTLLIGMQVLVYDQMIDLSAKGMFTNLKKQLLKAKI